VPFLSMNFKEHYHFGGKFGSTGPKTPDPSQAFPYRNFRANWPGFLNNGSDLPSNFKLICHINVFRPFQRYLLL
jgi:hypothetical protein